jgi:hypothetical protein
MKDSGGLIYWAWDQGRQGLDYRDSLEAAASAGTLVHEAAAAWLHGQPFEFSGPADVVMKAKRGYSAFLEWADQTKLKVLEAERSLVSERHRYGGTFDLVLIGQKRVMTEIKTSASIYPEHLLQVRGYGGLWEEHYPDQPIQGYQLLRFSREHGDFGVHFYPELDEAWEAFLCCRRLYDLKAAVGRRCR